MKSKHANRDPVAVSRSGPVTVITLLGEHDLTTTAALADSIDASAPANVIVDVTHAEFIDSSTINVLIRAQQLAVAEDRRLVLQYGTAPPVRKVFEITGVLETLPWAADREQAVQLARKRVQAPYGRDALPVASPGNA